MLLEKFEVLKKRIIIMLHIVGGHVHININ